MAALQVSDADNAKSGFARLAKCAELGATIGWTLTDDYIVVSDSTAHAKQIAAEGKKSPLSEDADFQKWTDEAGGAGIMNAYVGRKAVDVLSEELDSGLERPRRTSAAPVPPGRRTSKQLADALAAYKDFRGAAAVLRFADGGIELSLAGGGAKQRAGPRSATTSTTCRTTRRGCSPSPCRTRRFDALGSGAGPTILTGLIGRASGLDFPEDLKTLFGKSLSICLGGDAPSDLGSVSGRATCPLGLLVNGDAAGDRDGDRPSSRRRTGRQLSRPPGRPSKSKDGKVALASNPSSTPTSCSVRAPWPTTTASRTPSRTPMTPR